MVMWKLRGFAVYEEFVERFDGGAGTAVGTAVCLPYRSEFWALISTAIDNKKCGLNIDERRTYIGGGSCDGNSNHCYEEALTALEGQLSL